MATHVMLDLETMGTSKDAAIISIGAVKFDPIKSKLGDIFYRVVNLKSAQRAGGKIDADTILWWMGQNDEARKALTGDNSALIETVLREFSAWIREETIEGIWGNGSDFDNVILDNAYLRLGWTSPWSYKMNRCYRTICATHPEISREEFKIGVAHNAIDDAMSQAGHLCKILKYINIEKENK